MFLKRYSSNFNIDSNTVITLWGLVSSRTANTKSTRVATALSLSLSLSVCVSLYVSPSLPLFSPALSLEFSNSQNDFRVIELSTQTSRLESWTFSSSQHESSRVVDVLELSTQLDSSDGTLNTNRIERLKCLNCQDKLIGDMYVLELTSE